MTDQNTQELSMDEILASIRNILSSDTGSVANETLSQERKIAQPEVPFVAVSPTSSNSKSTVSDPTEEDIANICNNIRRLMDKPQPLKANTDQPQLSIPVVSVHNPVPQTAKHIAMGNDISSGILDDFAAIFAQRRKQQPQTDVSARNLAEAAVLNEVVPVLQQWLQEKLPQAVQKEIERVMAKAGIR